MKKAYGLLVLASGFFVATETEAGLAKAAALAKAHGARPGTTGGFGTQGSTRGLGAQGSASAMPGAAKGLANFGHHKTK